MFHRIYSSKRRKLFKLDESVAGFSGGGGVGLSSNSGTLDNSEMMPASAAVASDSYARTATDSAGTSNMAESSYMQPDSLGSGPYRTVYTTGSFVFFCSQQSFRRLTLCLATAF